MSEGAERAILMRWCTLGGLQPDREVRILTYAILCVDSVQQVGHSVAPFKNTLDHVEAIFTSQLTHLDFKRTYMIGLYFRRRH